MAMTLMGMGIVSAATMSMTSPSRSGLIASSDNARISVARVCTERLLNMGAVRCRRRV